MPKKLWRGWIDFYYGKPDWIPAQDAASLRWYKAQVEKSDLRYCEVREVKPRRRTKR